MDLMASIVQLNGDAQIYSSFHWDGFNCKVGLWLPLSTLDIKNDVDILLLRLDDHHVISDPIPLSSFQIN